MLSMVEYVHQRVQTYPQGLIGVDMTMGNGYDTVLLAKHCQEVYAFDVPVEALDQEFDLALIGTKGKWYDHKVSVSDAKAE